MSYLNKEHLQSSDIKTIDEIALGEVENYVEKVEGSTERTMSDNQNQQTQSNQSQQQNQVMLNSVAGSSTIKQDTKKIVLPIDEPVMYFGLRSSPSVGIKWLAEWCLMMIKKYPGRVFYSPTSNYD